MIVTAAIKWIKLNTDMFEDEKIDFIASLPEGDALLIIWIRLLTMAGKCNAGGYIFLTEQIPYSEDMLAHKFRKPVNVTKLALETFRKLGMIEHDSSGTLYLSNWEKHQNIEGMEKIREQTRLRVAKHREKPRYLDNGNEKCNVTVTQSNETDIDKDIEIDKENKIPSSTAVDSVDNVDNSPYSYYQQNIGPITSPVEADKVHDLIDRYGSNWLCKAVDIAVYNKARKAAYIEAILRRWDADGLDRKEDPTVKRSKPKQQRQAKPDCPQCGGTGKITAKVEGLDNPIVYTCDCVKLS